MNYIDFLEKFSKLPIISYQDIKNVFGSVNQSQLKDWKEKGKIRSVRRGFFVLPQTKLDPHIIANKINYSYLSLEYALSYYGIIPDVARVFTSVSKNRKEKISSRFGEFHYRKIKPELFTGFRVEKSFYSDFNFRIASPEKALFDLVYFRKDLSDNDDFDSLRLTLDKNFKKNIIFELTKQVKSGEKLKRLKKLIKYLDDII